MNGVRLFRSEATPSAIAGRVLARDVRDGAGCIALGKGTILDEGSLAAILPLAWEELHLVDPAPGERELCDDMIRRLNIAYTQLRVRRGK